ncbi:F0F1 ATP synthase subunit B [Atopobacter phocae]|uniref:F0F1 ATP synthase subunit B n=1 Tax=Atopobacter phocae TaxID=136492 RepID=UPI000472E9F4|nr:F0F1 ATP synthase subunit B [Atopobacter phocae]
MLAAAAFGIAVGDLLAIAISFILLMFLLGKFVWQPLTEKMDERSKIIQDAIDSAKEKDRSAQIAEEEARLHIREAKEEAQAIYQRAREAAEDLEKNAKARIEAMTQQMKREAEREIQYNKEKTMQDLQTEVGQLAVQLAQQILQKGLSASDHKELIDKFIEGIDEV